MNVVVEQIRWRESRVHTLNNPEPSFCRDQVKEPKTSFKLTLLMDSEGAVCDAEATALFNPKP